MTDREDEARGYAALGFATFPVHSILNGNCTCERPQCLAAAKHPRTPRGFKDATTSQQQIAGWDWSAANVGIRTGSGLLVVDVDPRHGGDETLWELEKRHGQLPEGPRSQTGGGGTHLFFTVDKPIKGQQNR
jgi:hypothetical protein